MPLKPSERCVEMVWWTILEQGRCSRKAGYGKDGLYCKQHAKKHSAEILSESKQNTAQEEKR